MSTTTTEIKTAPCPTCGVHSAATLLPASRRQASLIDALTDPKYPTVEAAALAAGYAPSSAKSYAYQLHRKLRAAGTIAHKSRLKLDKAKGQKDLAVKLLESAAQDERLAALPPEQKVVLASGLLKMSIETQQHLGGDDDDETSSLRVRVIRRRLAMLRRYAAAVVNGTLSPTTAERVVESIDAALGRV